VFGLLNCRAVGGHVDIEPGMSVVKPGGRTTGDMDGEVNGVLSDVFIVCPLLKHGCCYMTTEWTIISAHPYLTAMSRPGDSGSLIVERERLPQEPTASGDNRSDRWLSRLQLTAAPTPQRC
jgi:hypothetical protein